MAGSSFFLIFLESGDFRLGLLKLSLGLFQLFLKELSFLLGSQSPLLPKQPTGGQIASTDLSFLEFVFALSGFGFPSIPTLDKFRDDDVGWALKGRARSLRGCGGSHAR
jgi:hypothetical protein